MVRSAATPCVSNPRGLIGCLTFEYEEPPEPRPGYATFSLGESVACRSSWEIGTGRPNR
jgi:hypothetical protein